METSSIAEDFCFVHLEKKDISSNPDPEFSFFLDEYEYSQALPPPGKSEENFMKDVFLIEPNAKENRQDLHKNKNLSDSDLTADPSPKEDSYLSAPHDEIKTDEPIWLFAATHPVVQPFIKREDQQIDLKSSKIQTLPLASSLAQDKINFQVFEKMSQELPSDLHNIHQTFSAIQSNEVHENLKADQNRQVSLPKLREEKSDFFLTQDLTQDLSSNEINLVKEYPFDKKEVQSSSTSQTVPKNEQTLSIQKIQSGKTHDLPFSDKNIDQTSDHAKTDSLETLSSDDNINLDSLMQDLTKKPKKLDLKVQDLDLNNLQKDSFKDDKIEVQIEPPLPYTEHSLHQNLDTHFKDKDNLQISDLMDTKSSISLIADRIEEFALSQRNGKITIHLEPEELGTIIVKINTRGDQTKADIYASNTEVCKILDKNSLQLEQMLESKGLSLDSFTVSQQSGHQGHHQRSFSDSREEITRQVQLMSVRPTNENAQKSFMHPIVNLGSESGLDYRI